MKRSMIGLLVGFIATPALATPAARVCPAPQPASAMTATLSLNFRSARSLDTRLVPSRGNPYGDSDDEAESYDPAEVGIVPGTGLRLSTLPSATGKPYRSGGVSTLGKFAQRYGHFEASIRVPYQNGMWPAFWLIPADGTWPPEIDIVEFIGFPNGVTVTDAAHAPWFGMNPATTLHWLDANGQHRQATTGRDSGIDPTNLFPPAQQAFHTYAIDWRPGSITWLLDGKPVFCSSDQTAVPSKAMYLIINDAVSGGSKAAPHWAGYVPDDAKWPQTMDVAWVRVAQFKDLGAATSVPAPASAPRRSSMR